MRSITSSFSLIASAQSLSASSPSVKGRSCSLEERRCAIEFRSSAAEEWRLPRGRSLIAEENRTGEMGDADDDMVIIGYEVCWEGGEGLVELLACGEDYESVFFVFMYVSVCS